MFSDWRVGASSSEEPSLSEGSPLRSQARKKHTHPDPVHPPRRLRLGGERHGEEGEGKGSGEGREPSSSWRSPHGARIPGAASIALAAG